MTSANSATSAQPDETVDDSRLRCLAQHTEAKDEKPYDDAAFGRSLVLTSGVGCRNALDGLMPAWARHRLVGVAGEP